MGTYMLIPQSVKVGVMGTPDAFVAALYVHACVRTAALSSIKFVDKGQVS